MAGADGRVVNALLLFLLIQCGTVVADHTGELMYDTCFISQDESATDHDFCIMIYDYGNTKHSWITASSDCHTLNSNLLAIFNDEMYHKVQTILRTVFVSRTGTKIWIGGLRPHAENWMKINKELFTEPVAETVTGNCLSMKINGINSEYELDECDEMSGNHKVLCQFSPTAGSCGASTIKIANVCYGRPPNYMGDQISWFDARNECLKLPEGDLAYKNIENINRTQWNQIGLSGSSVWVGVQKQSWLWSGEPDTFDMKYTAWASEEGDEVLDDCTMLEYSGDQDGTAWRSTICYDRLQFYICYNASELTLHDQPATPDVNDELPTTDMQPPFDNNILIYIIIPIVLVLVIIIFIVGIICWRRKRKATTSSVPEQQPTNQIHRNDPESDPNMCTEISDVTETDEISPYAEFHEPAPSNRSTKKRISVFHQEVKQKLPKLPSMNRSKKPSKPGISPKPELKPSKTEDNSNGKPSESNVNIRHKQTPGGDVYALPVKAKHTPDDHQDISKQGADLEDVVFDNPTYGS